MLKHISENEFETEVLKENKVVVVDFFATWCQPCSMLAPILEEIQGEMPDIKIVKVDIDQNQNLAAMFRVASIPTIKIFKDGKDLSTSVGFMPKGVLKEKISSAL